MTPSLSQVLSQGGSASSVNPMYLLAGLAVFFLGAYTSVKVLGVLRRSRLMPALTDLQNQEKMEKLTFLIDELKSEKESAESQNTELQGRIKELDSAVTEACSAFDNARLARNTQEKSNLALLKEIDRLKSEKEESLLRASAPLLKTGFKNAVQHAVKNASKNKEGGRKTRRVLRKKTDGKK